MQCDYYQNDLCRSCIGLDRPYKEQLIAKEQELHDLLDAFTPNRWEKSTPSVEIGFRNKAKMQVLGFAHAPILGIVNHKGEEVSLCECPLYPLEMQKLLKRLEAWIKEAGIMPYRIDKKRGELKYILLSQAKPSGEFMLRFVLKSKKALEQIRSHLATLKDAFPKISVISVNIQPIHMAILEGEEEIFLSESQEIKSYLNDVPLYLRPKSFYQTNTQVAAQLYAKARVLANGIDASKIWDLFCGVGGFGLHCANKQTKLTGIEIEPEAIACAKLSAQELGLEDVSFEALDSALFAQEQREQPDLLIVNPPRRGLGLELCTMIQEIDPPFILYSSCNAKTLQKDLLLLDGYGIETVELFDMFPHTPHYEVLLLLSKKL